MKQYELNEIRSLLEGKEILLSGERTFILNVQPIRFEYSEELFLIAETVMLIAFGLSWLVKG